MEKIGIFGGTFNPPHMGHVRGAAACIAGLGLDKLIFVPAGIPPHKTLPAGSATPQQRLDMTTLAATLVDHATVSPVEIAREGKSYTVDTLHYFKDQCPSAQLFFIMGSDMLRSFANWHKPEEIAGLCTLVALCRDKADQAAMEGYAREITARTGADIVLLEHEIVTVSSTDIRSGRLRHLLPETIIQYIEEYKLYHD